MGPSWAVLEASWPVLGASWAVSAPSWRPLRPSWGDLWGLLGRFGASGSRKGENAKIFLKPKVVNEFCLLGPSWECSSRLLGASGGYLGRLRAIFRRLWALLDGLGGLPGRPWPVLGPSRGRGGHRPGGPRETPRERPVAPGSAQKRRGIRGSGPLRNYNPGPLSAA